MGNGPRLETLEPLRELCARPAGERAGDVAGRAAGPFDLLGVCRLPPGGVPAGLVLVLFLGEGRCEEGPTTAAGFLPGVRGWVAATGWRGLVMEVTRCLGCAGERTGGFPDTDVDGLLDFLEPDSTEDGFMSALAGASIWYSGDLTRSRPISGIETLREAADTNLGKEVVPAWP